MRLLLLSNIFPSAKSPHSAAFIDARIGAMRRAGHQVDPVAIGGRSARRVQDVRSDWGDARTPVSMTDRILVRRGHVRSAVIERAIATVQDLVELNRYDAVVAHGMYSLGAGHIGVELGERAKMPCTIHLHGSDVNKVMPRNPGAFSAALARAAGVTFVSQSLRDYARSYGYDTSNAHVVPNGVDLSVFSPDLRSLGRSELAIEQSAPVIAFVGGLLPVKGADRLPELFSRIRAKCPTARFVVVGEGPLAKKLESRMHTLPVQFTGQVATRRVAQIMAAADVIVMPSRSEGWPCVIHEAYAAGTPVVATPAGGIPEAILVEEHLVPPGASFLDRFAECAIKAMSADSVPVEHIRSWDAVVEQELATLERAR